MNVLNIRVLTKMEVFTPNLVCLESKIEKGKGMRHETLRKLNSLNKHRRGFRGRATVIWRTAYFTLYYIGKWHNNSTLFQKSKGGAQQYGGGHNLLYRDLR